MMDNLCCCYCCCYHRPYKFRNFLRNPFKSTGEKEPVISSNSDADNLDKDPNKNYGSLDQNNENHDTKTSEEQPTQGQASNGDADEKKMNEAETDQIITNQPITQPNGGGGGGDMVHIFFPIDETAHMGPLFIAPAPPVLGEPIITEQNDQ